MDKGKHIVDVDAKTVTFGHETKTLDGSIVLTTTIDFSKVDLKRLLKRAGDAELIGWRSKSGIKGLTTAEASKFQNITVDASAEVKREKHTETPEEAENKRIIASLNLDSATLNELLKKVLAAKGQTAE